MNVPEDFSVHHHDLRLIFPGKSVGQKRVLGWSWTLLTPLPNTPNADSSDIIIKPYSFPILTWFYLSQAPRVSGITVYTVALLYCIYCTGYSGTVVQYSDKDLWFLTLCTVCMYV